MLFKKNYILVTIIFIIGGFSPVFADSFEDAVDAVNRRDYETAYKMTAPLAEKGQAAAQLMLGMMYFKGTGVEKNIIEADKWLYVSEKMGQDAGKKNRIYVERQMTREQIEKAHKLGNEWLKNHKNVNPS